MSDHLCEACRCPGVEAGSRLCGSCAVLLEGITLDEPPATATTPDAILLRGQLDAAAARREIVWLQGRIAQLSRCRTFGPMARPQPR